MSIVAGLNNGAIQRLTSVWKILPKRTLEDFNTFENIFHPSQTYKNYKVTLAKREAPIIPYMGKKILFFYFY